MIKKRKARQKRALAFLLSLCMAFCGFISDVMPVQAAVAFYASDKDLKPYQSEISNWSSGCHVCSVAMLLTAMGKSGSTPYEVWKNNNRNVGIVWDNIHKKYDVQTKLEYFSGTSDDKYKKLYSLCQQYPYGIDVYAPYINSNGVKQSHFVYAFIENGTLYIHNPGYASWSYRIVGKNATHYDDYSNFESYRIFTDKGGGTVTPPMSDTVPPVISNVRVVEPYRGGYNVECDVTDNVGVTKVEFPTWTVKNGQDDLKWHIGSPWRQNANGSITYKVNINVSDHNNEQGYYTTHIYAYDAAGNSSFAAVSPDTCVDWINPVISDIKITDQTNTGYTVQCRVTDNVGVSRVRFPTWTEKNGQDDLWWGEGTKNGDIYSYRVNISDHNNEYGIYHNHIYAYDVAGNEVSVAAPDSDISTITIKEQPEDYTGEPGESILFKVIATGSNLEYQWQRKDKNAGNWVDISPGRSIPKLWISAGEKDDQSQFRCVITDGINTIFSRPATLTVVKRKRYTVTFDSQGGTSVNDLKYIIENTTVSSLPNPPVKNRFVFVGWYTEPDGQGRVFDENTVVRGNMTVYAYWNLQTNSVPDGFWVNDIPSQNYTGKAIKPRIEVYDGAKLLREKFDYTLSYKNNTKANDASDVRTAPTVVVKGKGNYAGVEKVTFAILPKNIDDEDVVIKDITKSYKNAIQKAVPAAAWNGRKLKNKTDFVLKYPDTDKDAYMAEGTYQIDVIGKGNFTGKKSILFTIGNKKQISKVSVTKIPDQSYTGNDILPEVVAKDGKVWLEENRDYFLSFENTREIGKAAVILNGMGAYCGEKRITFQITGMDIKKAAVKNIPTSVVYTGDSITANPYLVIENDGNEIRLEEDRDYTVSYQKNNTVGTATIVFKGINNYSGTLKRTFKIAPYNIEEDRNHLIKMENGIAIVYVAGGSKPKTTVYFGEQILTEGRDYTLKYSNNQVISSLADPEKPPVMTVCGKGNFSGSVTMPFTIVPQSMESLAIETQDKVYQNTAGKYKSVPKIMDLNGKALKAGKDYERDMLYTYAEDTVLPDGILKPAGSSMEPTDVLPAGTKILVTVTGKGNYTGTISDVYRITQSDIRSARVQISGQTYTGSEICPGKADMEIKIGKTVLSDTDYEIVGYTNNVKKGTDAVIIRGAGDYGGTKKATFKISAKGFKWWWR